MLKKNSITTLVVDKVPLFASKALPWVPKKVQSHALATAFQLFFKQDLAAGRLRFMAGKIMKLTVTDIGATFYIQGIHTAHGDQLQVTTYASRQEDVFMSGSMDDLYLLTTHSVDPDTLFFRRKLMLSGDTELGLEIKNFLDTIDIRERLPKQVYQASMHLAEAVMDKQAREKAILDMEKQAKKAIEAA